MNMNKCKKILFCIITIWLLSGCYKVPSDTDIVKLKLIENKYPDYEFILQDEFYLKVKIRRDMDVSENDLKEIYKKFFWDERKNSWRETTFVYLNFYDSKDKFRYQIAFDRSKNDFIRNKTEYY